MNILNDVLGSIDGQDNTGTVYQDALLRQISTKKLFLFNENKYKTSFSASFHEQDVFQNDLLACPNFFGCIQSTYVVPLKGSTATEVSFARIDHPGSFAAGLLQEADFGNSTNMVIAHIHFPSASDGASDAIYRYDVGSKTFAPIFATYCDPTNFCSNGAYITGLRVSRSNSRIYFILSVGDVKNPSQSIASIPMDSPAITLLSPQQVTTKSWDPSLQNAVLYSHGDSLTTINNLDISLSGKYVFVITRGKQDPYTNDGFCRISTSDFQTSCQQVAPFYYISDMVNISDDSFIYTKFSSSLAESGIYYYSLQDQTSSPVVSPYSASWLFNLTY